MLNLSKAIYTKAAASTTFWNLIGGRFYKNVRAENWSYPYVIYKLVSGDPLKSTFQETIEDTEWQFSIFSSDWSSTEAENIYTALHEAFDECILTITGNTHLQMVRLFYHLFEDEIDNPNGWDWVWHYVTDYNIQMQKN